MNNFQWVEPKNIGEASTALKNGGAALGGGIELLCLLKDNLLEPARVVNLKSLPGMRSIETSGGLKIGALVSLDAIAKHRDIRDRYSAISQAAESVASPQIRNVGTLGGNLCQRPRCWYFRDSEVNCLKKGGTKCFAVNGDNEYHAILGGGPCYIVHPSDLAPALIALGATVTTNTRKMPLDKFFVLPSQDVHNESVLQSGEIVTGVELGAGDWKSAYYKARERRSFDWALSSCAAALKMNGSTVSDARIILGGVAPVPWRSAEAENALKGKAISEAVAEAAAKEALAGAAPLSDNKYKVPLSESVIKIAVLRAAGMNA